VSCHFRRQKVCFIAHTHKIGNEHAVPIARNTHQSGPSNLYPGKLMLSSALTRPWCLIAFGRGPRSHSQRALGRAVHSNVEAQLALFVHWLGFSWCGGGAGSFVRQLGCSWCGGGAGSFVCRGAVNNHLIKCHRLRAVDGHPINGCLGGFKPGHIYLWPSAFRGSRCWNSHFWFLVARVCNLQFAHGFAWQILLAEFAVPASLRNPYWRSCSWSHESMLVPQPSQHLLKGFVLSHPVFIYGAFFGMRLLLIYLWQFAACVSRPFHT